MLPSGIRQACIALRHAIEGTKLIDDNKTVEAKTLLQSALDTLEVTYVVVPLPIVAAKIGQEKVEELAKKKGRTQQENKELSDRVAAADTQIKYAKELGYGPKAILNMQETRIVCQGR